jgi:lysyl-tRNA synthetase, class II
MATNKSTTTEQAQRKKRLQKIQEQGIGAYPATSSRTHTIADGLEHFKELSKNKKSVTLVGRLRSMRKHGGSIFAHLEDVSASLQVYFKKDELGDKDYEQVSQFLDVGDFVQATGVLFSTKRGEQTLLVAQWQLLAKALEPLPEKWHGLNDKEIRFRKRYLDLIVNKEVRQIFKTRAAIIKTMRSFLDRHHFLEVETPILQPIPGGANAQPFKTHHNALNNDFYLRIAPELYLKRLTVGGLERVYEFARCFRNEGIDWGHNPEFTMLEFYIAYMDYTELMDFTEDLVLTVLDEILEKRELEYQDKTIKFKKPFKRITFRDALIEHANVDIENYPDHTSLYKKAKELGLEDISPKDGRGKLCDELYKELARPKMVQPTFLIDHPVELSPLAKKKPDNENYVERFQLVVAGEFELCNCFSEINNPIDQLERFREQQKLAEAGDKEAHPVDKDYVEALEHGMPPTAGFGMGIDRLTALLTDTRNIKEVILFPTLRPKQKA